MLMVYEPIAPNRWAAICRSRRVGEVALSKDGYTVTAKRATRKELAGMRAFAEEARKIFGFTEC